MEVRLLACESLGVRSLATVVRTKRSSYLLDPGVSLAPRRSSLPPHPIELAASYIARKQIEEAARTVETVILTHYHHDHFTPFEFRRDEWSDLPSALSLYRGKRLFGKAPDNTLNRNQRKRAATIFEKGFRLEAADGRSYAEVHFSPPVPHGEETTNRGCVIMVLFEEGEERFAYGSDIQLLNDKAVEILLAWRPSLCVLSGPPLYLDVLSSKDKALAAERAVALAKTIPILVIDHHLPRIPEHRSWLEKVAERTGNAEHSVLDGAGLLGKEPLCLESKRKELFSRYPVKSFSYLKALEKKDRAVTASLIKLAEQLERSWSLEQIPLDLLPQA